MPTLFRLLFVTGLLFAAGYGSMYAIASLVRPEERVMVEAVALPQTAADVHTGRSVAERLDREASALVRHHRRASH